MAIRLYHPQYGFTGPGIVPGFDPIPFTNGVASVNSLTDQQVAQLHLYGYEVIDDALASPGNVPVMVADIADATSDAGAALRAAYAPASTRLRGSQRIKNMALTPAHNAPTMASPPTITQAATGTSGLTKTISYTQTDLFRWNGPLLLPVATTGAQAGRGYTKGDTQLPVPNAANAQFAFDFDGAQFDLEFKANSTLRYRLWVNEQAAAATMQSPPSATNAFAYLNVNFGSASLGNPRRIVIELEDTTSAQMPFYGLKIAPTDSVTYPAIPSPRVIIVGDSFGVGVGATYGRYGYTKNLGRLMGWADCWDTIGSVGGTGLVKDSTASAAHYLTRLAQDVIPYNPDLVIVQGSVNDRTYAGTNVVGPALTTYVNTLRASLPNTVVVATSVLTPAAPTANDTTNNTDLAAAAQALGIPYVDMSAPAVFTGTGKVGATVGDGNADVYRANDGTHPVDVGHAMIAANLAARLGQVLGLPV